MRRSGSIRPGATAGQSGEERAETEQRASPAERPCRIDPVITALRKGDLAAIGPVIRNRLTEPARQLSPAVEQVLGLLATQNCPAVGMSGSGTSCFALCRTARHAGAVAVRVRARSGTRSLVWSVCSM